MENWDFELQTRHNGQWHMDRPHFHEGYELLVPLTCGGSVFIDRRAWPLRRGFLFFIDDGVPHRSFSGGGAGYSRYVLHFSRETLLSLGGEGLAGRASDGSRCLALRPKDFSRCAGLLRLIDDPGWAPGRILRQRSAFLALLALVCELWADVPAPWMLPSGPADAAAEPAIEYIRAHLERPIKLDDLAAQCFISKSTLCHRFKEATGFSVGEYITHCRVQRARILLRRGVPVQKAGEESGFGDNAHFIRTFKRLTGMPPGQYAKTCRPRAAEGGKTL